MTWVSNLKKAILIDEKNNKHYVYGSLAEVEAFASKLKITSKKYINHISPSMMMKNFKYVGGGNNPTNHETSTREMSYRLNKIVIKEKW